jgi:hypothetical protein
VAIAASVAAGCAATSNEIRPAPAPEPARSTSGAVGASTLAACYPDRCLAVIDQLLSAWTIFERLGVPDPDSVAWIEGAGRQEYLSAAHVSLADVPTACRAPDAECDANWEIRLVGVEHREGSCPQAVIELQLVLSEIEMAVEHRVGAPVRFQDDFVALEEADTTPSDCEAAIDPVDQ